MLHCVDTTHTFCDINGTFSVCLCGTMKWNINLLVHSWSLGLETHTDLSLDWRYLETWHLDCTCFYSKREISTLFFLQCRRFSDCFLLFFFFLRFSFVTAQCGLQFSSRGVRPGITTVLARHLDKNTMGYLQWRWGIQSSMNTSIVRDTKSSHFTFAMQVSSQRLF